ncbi:MAG: nuclease-related domain-containing protein [Chloroflexia bacterium]
MNSILISILPDTSTLFVIIATLLTLFGALAFLRANAGGASRHRLTHAFDFPFPTGAIAQIPSASRNLMGSHVPTGAISQIPPASRNPMFSHLLHNTGSSTVRPTGSIMSIPTVTGLPLSYAGPVVVQGRKYLWESRWSHLPSFEQGREGEERVVSTLMNTLGNGWYIFRNFVLPTENEDIDVVLVGHAGVFTIEVNAWGEVPSERARCYARTAHGRIYRQRRAPNSQARGSAARLNTFLKERGIAGGNYVQPLVVVAGDSNIERSSMHMDVCTLTTLRSRLNGLAVQSQLTSSQVRGIAGVLQAATGEQMRTGLSRVH